MVWMLYRLKWLVYKGFDSEKAKMFFEEELLNRRNVITEDESFKKFEISLNELIDFIWSLSNLISWNGHIILSVIKGKKFMLQTELIDSVVKTLCSIRMCCQYGNISDANTLIRKYRDDMFLFLYFIEVSKPLFNHQ